MIEFELKFQIPAGQLEAVRGFVCGRKRPAIRPIHLQASYFDTSQRLLARSGIALRVRREGAGWVQTLKGMAADGLGREEYNVPLTEVAGAGSPPGVDPRRHRGVPLGDRLLDLLTANPDDMLQCSYRSDVQRLRRHLKTRFGTVELALDEGHLAGGTGRLALCELEIELIDGHPLAVIDVARRWALRFGLSLDTRSKAERGDLLARGLAVAAPQSNLAPPTLHAHHCARTALQAALVSVRQPILANASQIASGCFYPEHLHQLRVMLRRLRTYLRLFADDPDAAGFARPLAEPAADLFRGLGAGRDQSVLAGPLSQCIEAALREAGADGEPRLPAPDDVNRTMSSLVRSTASQHFLLDLIAASLPAFVDARRLGDGDLPIADARSAKGVRLRALLLHRLARWQQSIARDARKFDQLDEVGRHRLRKHVKRLRYAIEVASNLLDKRRAMAIGKPIKRAQKVLGDLNDLATALQAFATAEPGADHRAWFARGWMVARQEALLAAGAMPMKKLARAARRKRLR